MRKIPNIQFVSTKAKKNEVWERAGRQGTRGADRTAKTLDRGGAGAGGAAHKHRKKHERER